MKYTMALIVAIILLFNHPLFAQSPEVKHLVDTTIELLKRHSVNRDSVNWETIKKTAFQKANGIIDAYQTGPIMRYLYESVNDFHGTYFYKDSSFKIKHHEKPVSDSIRNEWAKGINIKTDLLPYNIGYLRMPYISTGTRQENNNKAQSLNDSLCSLLKQNIEGLVLDLRLNGGGDMRLMILGVKQLLGEGKLGSFITDKNGTWILKYNSFLLDTTEIVNIRPTCNISAQNMPVVILTSSATGSSGEFLLMAFKGRKNTIVLGEETAGYITVIAGLPVSEAAYMYVSVGYGADRTDRIYKEALKPDITLYGPDNFNNIRNDIKVKAAIDIITGKHKLK